MTLLDPEHTAQAYSRLSEIIDGPEELNNKLLQVRQLLEGVYKKLASDSGLSFSGLFARMQYSHEKLEAPREISAQLNQLRILCNKAAHEEKFQASQTIWLSAVHATRSLLLWLAPDIRNDEIERFVAQNEAQPFSVSAGEAKLSFQCVLQAGNLSGVRIWLAGSSSSRQWTMELTALSSSMISRAKGGSGLS